MPPSLTRNTGEPPRTTLHNVTEHESNNPDAGDGNEDHPDPEPPAPPEYTRSLDDPLVLAKAARIVRAALARRAARLATTRAEAVPPEESAKTP